MSDTLSDDGQRVLDAISLYRDDLYLSDLRELLYGRLTFTEYLILDRWADEYDTVGDVAREMERRQQAGGGRRDG